MSNSTEKFIFEADGASLLQFIAQTDAKLKAAKKEGTKLAASLLKAGQTGRSAMAKVSKEAGAAARQLGLAKGRLSSLNTEAIKAGRAGIQGEQNATAIRELAGEITEAIREQSQTGLPQNHALIQALNALTNAVQNPTGGAPVRNAQQE